MSRTWLVLIVGMFFGLPAQAHETEGPPEGPSTSQKNVQPLPASPLPTEAASEKKGRRRSEARGTAEPSSKTKEQTQAHAQAQEADPHDCQKCLPNCQKPQPTCQELLETGRTQFEATNYDMAEQSFSQASADGRCKANAYLWLTRVTLRQKPLNCPKARNYFDLSAQLIVPPDPSLLDQTRMALEQQCHVCWVKRHPWFWGALAGAVAAGAVTAGVVVGTSAAPPTLGTVTF